jgi:monovalent cation:H+ antiporter-2, CPA2 family
MEQPYIFELAVRVLAIAAAAVLVCVRLRIPSVAGLLVAGALAGPSGFGWVTEVETVERVAEFGVVLLLFVIGLEVSRERLRELGRWLALGGPLQVGVTAAIAAGTALVFGASVGAAILVGCVVSISSTALVLKLYGDRGELDSLHGRAVLGILLFQDLVVVPMMVVVPALSAGATGLGGDFLGRLAAGLAALGLAVLVGRVLLPRLLAIAARGRSREAFLLGAVVLCIGMAWLTQRLGLSAALGAFVAGFLLADSEYAHEALADVVPLRELFASVFFVAMGMLVDLSFVARRPLETVAVTLAVIALKAVVAGGAVAALGVPRRTAVVAGLGLAQVGEFSFVLLELGRVHQVLAGEPYQLLLATSALSMLATPALVLVAPHLVARLGESVPRGRAEEPAPTSPPQVLIVGYGANGEILARILHETSIRYRIIDADAERVKRARAAGEPVLFGDATRPEILAHAGAAEVRVAVIAISDARAVVAAVRGIRRLSKQAKILVRTRRLREVGMLERAGADRVVAEEYESAIAIYTWALEELHVPRNVIAAQTRVLRGEDYRMLRGGQVPAGVSKAVAEALAAGTTDVFRLSEESPAVGRDLSELDLRRRSGATVLAVVRDEKPHLTPPADFRLQAGDELVLVGAHAQVEAAFVVLEESA